MEKKIKYKNALCIDGIYRLVKVQEREDDDYSIDYNEGTTGSEDFYAIRKFKFGKIKYD